MATKEFPAELLAMREQRDDGDTHFHAIEKLDDISEDFADREVAVYGLLRVGRLGVTKSLIVKPPVVPLPVAAPAPEHPGGSACPPTWKDEKDACQCGRWLLSEPGEIAYDDSYGWHHTREACGPAPAKWTIPF